MREKVSQKSRIVWWVVLFAMLIIAGAVILNRRWLVDFWRGTQYTPSTEMAEIRDELTLTDKGRFLFNALQPMLNEADEFNASCHQNASETAVLGCYADGVVRVYNITTPELEGIREVTTAHELLHAVWARMSASEQARFGEALEEVLQNNQAILESELGTYDDEAKQEEIYVRAGTEIAELPAVLEQHFGEYFADRGKIVNHYNNYIAVFNEKKAQAAALEDELPKLRKQIYAEIDDYEAQAEALEAEVVEFNNCARQAMCFATESEFLARRGELLGRQQELKTMNEGINAEIVAYNQKVDEYNQVVDDSRKLEKEINSNALTEVDF